MTTMPPEMSTVTTSTPIPVQPTKDKHCDSLLMQQSSRSRFMITDILAGSAAAAAAVLRTENKVESARLLNRNIQCTKNLNKYSNPHQSHEINQTTLQKQHPYFTSSMSYQHQQLALASHTEQLLASEHGQCGQESSLSSGDFLSNIHDVKTNNKNVPQSTRYTSLQRFHQNLNVINTESPTVKLGESGLYCGVYHDDRSRSPLNASKIPTQDFSVQNDQGKIIGGSGVSGGSISGDQASTIDESDSDTCGGRDEDTYSSKSEGLTGLSKKQRKARTAFTDHQLQSLEKTFERQKYLSVQDRMELANKLELSDCQVKTWYQNRRTKWKRQTAVGLELLAEAGNYAAFQRLYGNSPYFSTWPYAAQPTHSAPANAIDMYFRQAAAAAVLQKPISYRMYPSPAPMSSLPSIPIPPSSFPHLNAINPLSTLSGYYHSSAIVQHPPENNNPQLNNDVKMSPIRVEIDNTDAIPQLRSGNLPVYMGKEGNVPQLVDDDNDIDDGDIEV